MDYLLWAYMFVQLWNSFPEESKTTKQACIHKRNERPFCK